MNPAGLGPPSLAGKEPVTQHRPLGVRGRETRRESVVTVAGGRAVPAFAEVTLWVSNPDFSALPAAQIRTQPFFPDDRNGFT